MIGSALTAVGIWYAFWSPVAFRNLAVGWKILLVGLIVMICGIVVMTANFEFGGGTRTSLDGFARSDWTDVFSHRMGPIPYGAFVAFALIATVALALRNSLKPTALLGAALFIAAILILLYFMGPQLFPHTW